MNLKLSHQENISVIFSILLLLLVINYIQFSNFPFGDYFEIFIFWLLPSFISWLLYCILNHLSVFVNKKKYLIVPVLFLLSIIAFSFVIFGISFFFGIPE
jgi:Kef-type K+ transport system membrane component KefB